MVLRPSRRETGSFTPPAPPLRYVLYPGQPYRAGHSVATTLLSCVERFLPCPRTPNHAIMLRVQVALETWCNSWRIQPYHGFIFAFGRKLLSCSRDTLLTHYELCLGNHEIGVGSNELLRIHKQNRNQQAHTYTANYLRYRIMT